MTTITNDGSDIIFQSIEKNREWDVDTENFENIFNLKGVLQWITENKFEKVGLQLPNELLSISFDICSFLQERCASLIVVLADTSFGSCCVDEIAGERLGIDAIVHFGKACLTNQMKRLPIRYEFGSLEVEQDTLESWVRAVDERFKNKEVLVFYDFRYQTAAKKLCRMISTSTVVSEPDLDFQPEAVAGRIFPNSIKDITNVVYLGKPNLSLYRIALSLNMSSYEDVVCLDPVDGEMVEFKRSMHAFLSRRMYLIEKVKCAKRVGLLIGTLSVDHYAEMLDRLISILKCAGISHTLLLIGKLNAAKLTNMTEIDVFVFVACPESSLIDSRDFLIPLVTPFEMECALAANMLSDCDLPSSEGDHLEDKSAHVQKLMRKRVWTGATLYPDFKQLLCGGKEHVPLRNFQAYSDMTPSVSLITGQLNSCLSQPTKPAEGDVAAGALVSWDESSRQLVEACQWQSSKRSWRGLEPRLGLDAVPTEVTQGRSGLPIGYENETS